MTDYEVLIRKKMKHIVSFSGGKDSTAMLLRMIELDMPIDKIVFSDTGLEFPELYEYIKRVEKYIGKKITIIKPKRNWDDYFYSKVKKGSNKGIIYGFPLMMGAWCNSRLKMLPLERWFKKQGNHIRYIGIASDETNRKKNNKNYKYPLMDWEWTEKKCLIYLKKKGLENPLYKKFKRIGCWLCPKQNKDSLRVLYQDYPELWNKLKKYEEDSPVAFKPDFKLKEVEDSWKNQTKLSSQTKGEEDE